MRGDERVVLVLAHERGRAAVDLVQVGVDPQVEPGRRRRSAARSRPLSPPGWTRSGSSRATPASARGRVPAARRSATGARRASAGRRAGAPPRDGRGTRGSRAAVSSLGDAERRVHAAGDPGAAGMADAGADRPPLPGRARAAHRLRDVLPRRPDRRRGRAGARARARAAAGRRAPRPAQPRGGDAADARGGARVPGTEVVHDRRRGEPDRASCARR